MTKLTRLITSIILCEGIGILGTPFTISSVQTWFKTLNKPFFAPPNWIFGPVWTILYLMMGISFFLVWEKGLKNAKVKNAMFFFLMQLFFNFLWSIIFFGLHSPFYAFIDIILLLIFLVITILKFYKISKTASLLLIPYLLWVSFASILNLSIYLLNLK